MITHAIISVSDLRTPLKGPFINPFQETQPNWSQTHERYKISCEQFAFVLP